MAGRYVQVPLDDPEPVTRVELRVVSPNVGEKLPSYHHTTVVLPSYEEVQNLKASEDANTPRHASPSAAPQLDGMPLGDDVSFIGTFLVSLLFNWIGYLVCFCLATSIAARSGALAGFGLAFVKIAVLLKYLHNNGEYANFFAQYGDRMPVYHEWAIWVAVAIGALFFLRGVYVYHRAKRMYLRSLP